MPKKTNNKITKASARKATVAKRVIEGKTEKEIANELGVTRDRVAQIKADPETQDLLAKFFSDHDDEFQELVELSIKAVKETLKASKEILTIGKKGQIEITYVADHRARIAAVQRVQHWQEMSRPKDKNNNDRLPTYEELLIIRRRYFENPG